MNEETQPKLRTRKPLAVGNMVRLKSGSRAMTVIEAETCGSVHVAWMETYGGKLNRAVLPAAAFKRSKPDADEDRPF